MSIFQRCGLLQVILGAPLASQCVLVCLLRALGNTKIVQSLFNNIQWSPPRKVPKARWPLGTFSGVLMKDKELQEGVIRGQAGPLLVSRWCDLGLMAAPPTKKHRGTPSCLGPPTCLSAKAATTKKQPSYIAASAISKLMFAMMISA